MDPRDFSKPQKCSIEIYNPDLDHKKTIYSNDVWRNKFVRSEMGAANVPVPFSPDVYWDINPNGKVVIGYSNKYELVIYDSIKNEQQNILHTYKPIKVTKQDKNNHFLNLASLVSEGQKEIPDYITKNTDFPRFKPAFNNIIVDSEGNILVHLYTEKKAEMYKRFEAFDIEGNFIGNVVIEGDINFPDSRFVYAKGKCFWVIGLENNGLFAITKLRIKGS